MKKIFLLTTLFFAGTAAFCDETLVKDGQPEAVIVLEQKPTQSAQMGALELRYFVKQITGAELPIVKGPVKGKVNIRIGGHNEGIRNETSVMTFDKDGILLTGNDSPIYTEVKYSDQNTFPSNEFRYNGSLWAVYDFLERCCGVRFYGMDELDEVYPTCKTLTVKEINRTYTPKMEAFREVYPDGYYGGEVKEVSPRDLMLWKLRWRMCCFYGRTNHNMASIYFAHYKRAKTKHLAPVFESSHPEYFAQGYRGAGGGRGDWLLNMNYPDDPDVPPQLCYSSDGVRDWYAKEVLEYAAGRNVKGGFGNKTGSLPVTTTTLPRFEGKPFYYPIEGADNGSFCKCAECQKTLGNGMNVSMLKFRMMSEIAKKVAEKDPTAGVSSLAYIQSLYYPEGLEMHPNLSIMMCLTVYSWWHPAAYKLQHGIYKKWLEKEGKKRTLTLWTYLFSTYWDTMHFGRYKAFPGFYPWKTAEMFKEFCADDIKGWFSECHVRYNILEGYVANRVCFDPSVDTDAMLDEYFDLYYGPGGKAMKEFFREVEAAYWNPDNCPKEWLADPDTFVGPAGKKHPFWGTGLFSPEICWQMGTDARMAKLDNLIKEAQAKITDPRQKARLDKFIKVIWEPALQGKKDFDELQKLPKQNTTVTLPRLPEANGDLSKVDWSKAYESTDFTDTLGRPTPRKTRIRMGMDSKYLYLYLHERNAAPEKGKMLWRENAEIFFMAHKGYPIYHIGISPFGEKDAYCHSLVNDAEHSDHYDFQEKLISKPGKNSWELMIAFPLDRLPFKGDEMVANFFRTWGAHGQFSVWSPINQSYYMGGIQRFGTLKKAKE